MLLYTKVLKYQNGIWLLCACTFRHDSSGLHALDCRAGIINWEIDISLFCINHWWFDLSDIRSSTFQAFCRTLNFLNQAINKHVMCTFVIAWSEILFNLCLLFNVLVKSLISVKFSNLKVLVKVEKESQHVQ